MTDQNSQFFAILTAVGEAKQANANALGVPWTFAQMGVGDANNTDPVPSRTQTKLINERRRALLNQLTVDPKDTSVIIAEQVIPPDVGGWWIREIGLYDTAGDLVAVANCAPSYKPLLAQGTGKTQVVRLNLVVTSSANVQLKIDPAVVLATRDYVDSAIISVLPRNKIAGTYTKVRINDRGVVQEGSNPTTLAGYGITDGFAQSTHANNFDALKKTGLYNLGNGDTLNRPSGFAGSLALHHDYTDYAFTLASNMGTDSVAFRRWVPTGFTPWRFLWHSGNFDPAGKADKATTLAGYGITDAMPKGGGGLLAQAGPVQGRITNVPETRFIATTAATDDRPTGITYAAGFHITWGSGDQCIDFLGALNGQEEFFVRSSYQGGGTFRKLWTEANFTPALKANLLSPVFTGTPRVPNAAVGTATDQAANTKFVADAIAALVASSPAALDTLNELAAALGNDPNFATTMTNALAGKLNVANANMTGVPTCSTANLGTSTKQVANTEFVQSTVNALVGSAPTSLNTLAKLAASLGNDPAFLTNALAGKLNVANAAMTGIPTCSTANLGSNTMQVANTAFVQNSISALVGSAPGALDTLGELSAALGNDPNFSTNVTNQLANKFNKAGGAIGGAVSVTLLDQALGNPGISVNNPGTTSSTKALLTLACGNTSISLVHLNQDPSLHLLNGFGTLQALSAGTVYSNGAPAHTSASFLKPVQGQWVTLNGSGQLPSGGSWAYFGVGYNGGGQALGAVSGVAAGGSVVGYNSNTVGFAWRIQ